MSDRKRLISSCRRTWSGDEEHIEWAKIHTPTDEVVVPYDTLESPPEGAPALQHASVNVNAKADLPKGWYNNK